MGRDYSIDEMISILIQKYGEILKERNKWLAYEFLKEKSGFKNEQLPEEVYKRMLENILGALEL